MVPVVVVDVEGGERGLEKKFKRLIEDCWVIS